MTQDMNQSRSSARPWWSFAGTLAIALLFAAGGIYVYLEMAAWDSAGGPTRRAPFVIVRLYEFGGRTLIGGSFAVLTLVLIGSGLSQLRTDRADEREEHRADV